MQALEIKRASLVPEEFWNQAVALLADSPNEMELDRHLLRLAGQYPGMSDVTKAQQALRREVNKIRRSRATKGESSTPIRAFQTSQLQGELSSAELVIFRAFLSLEYRKSGWMFARVKSLFGSTLAIKISEAITRAFETEAPEGEPALWLHRIDDEILRQTIADLLMDPRADRLNETYIADTVELLSQQQKKRALNQIRKGDLDTAKRQEYLLKLREHKPIYEKKQQDDDNFFG
jgi:hypothetical protein